MLLAVARRCRAAATVATMDAIDGTLAAFSITRLTSCCYVCSMYPRPHHHPSSPLLEIPTYNALFCIDHLSTYVAYLPMLLDEHIKVSEMYTVHIHQIMYSHVTDHNAINFIYFSFGAHLVRYPFYILHIME